VPDVTWDPTAAPAADEDATLLGDFTNLASIHADGGLLMGSGNTSQEDLEASFTFDGAGAIRAVPASTPTASHVSYFVDGLLDGDEFTVQVEAKHPTLAWDDASAHGTILAVRGPRFIIYAAAITGSLDCGLEVLPSAPSGTAGKAAGGFTASLAGLNADTWYVVAIVYRAGQIKVYVNGVLKGTSTIALPARLSDAAGAEGIMFGGTVGTPSGFWVRRPAAYITGRIPGTPVTLKSLDGTLTVDTATVEGTTSRAKIGALHPPLLVGADPDQISAAFGSCRTDKAVGATPTKAGGTDGTHPSLGESGLYSYDWQVFDRSVDEVERLGMDLVLGFDPAPQILGGNAPFSGADLTTKMSLWASFSYEPPDDLGAWETIVADHVHRLVVQRGKTVHRYTWWNEPEIAFNGTMSEALDCYAATVAGIRQHDPTTPVCGVELADFSQGEQEWVTAQLDQHVGDDVDLDIITYHDYSGDVLNFGHVVAIIERLAAIAGSTMKPIRLGEFNWSLRNMYSPTPDQFFTHRVLHIQAFAAAYTTAFLCNALEHDDIFDGLHYSHINSYTGDPLDGGFATMQATGVFDPETGIAPQWAPYNALQGFQMVLGDERLALTQALPPGVYAYAGRDTATGRIGVALANTGWCNRSTRTVELSIAGMTTGRVRRYLVDQTHSSPWDTAPLGGPDDPYTEPDQLELVSDTVESDLSALSVDLPQWSSTFITIDDTSVPTIPGLFMVGGVPCLAVAP
jgi:hypothetical protein